MNFERIWTEIECPKCSYKNDIQLLDIKLENKIHCSNCKITIQLKDDNASAHITINNINNLLTDLDNLFK